MAKLPTTEEIDAATAAFDPYYSAVGKVVHAWNHLQEELAQVFCVVTGLNNSVGLAIWHTVQSDRGQREMLRSAVHAACADEEWAEKFPDAKESIDWLLNEANKVADRRNDAIHAPCSVTIGTEDFEIIPFSFLGNPRAKKLHTKDILAEFAWYAQSASVLKQHAQDVEVALSAAGKPWPDKPRMPALEHRPSHTEPRRRSAAK
jgi:hypothetical protein